MPDAFFKDGSDKDGMGQGKAILPFRKTTMVIPIGEVNSPVYNVTGLRGIGLNFPLLPAVTGFDIYVSNTAIKLGDANSKMAKLGAITTMVPDAVDRTAFSTSFIAEHLYMQIVADSVEIAEYEIEVSAE